MLPASIEILHDLENHEHNVCTSVGEQHIHKQNINCGEFHKQLTVFSKEISANCNVIPKHFYKTSFVDKPQKYLDVYQLKKPPRGPPFFTV